MVTPRPDLPPLGLPVMYYQTVRLGGQPEALRDRLHVLAAMTQTFARRGLTLPPEVIKHVETNERAWEILLEVLLPIDTTRTWTGRGALYLRLQLGTEHHLDLPDSVLDDQMIPAAWLLDLLNQPSFVTIKDARSGKALRLTRGMEVAVAIALLLGCTLAAPDGRLALDTHWRQLITPKSEPPKEPRPGHLRVDLGQPDTLQTGHSEQPCGSIPVQLHLVLASKTRPGHFNQPRHVTRAPLDALENLRDPSVAEVVLATAVEACNVGFRAVDHGTRWRDDRPKSLERSLVRLFEALVDFPQVYWQDAKVQVSSELWHGRLVVSDRDAGLWVRLDPAPEAIWPVGDGWVLQGGTLCPLRPGTMGLVARLGVLGGVLVPAPDLPAFMESVLPAPHFKLSIESARIAVRQEQVEPRLMLLQDDQGLRVSHGWRYAGVDINADHLGHVAVPGGLSERDTATEDALTAELTRVLGAEPPHLLSVDDGFDFLADGLPLLAGWIIEADRRLVKPRGMVGPRITVESGQDWFDLGVAFEVDGQSVGLKAVLSAWRHKRRYVVLPDGTAARLPEAWLAQHGESVDDLSRRRKGERLGAVGAVVFADLLGEAGRAAQAAAEDASQAAAEAAERWLAIARRLRNFDGLKARPAPKALRAELRPYQLTGLRWLAGMRDHGLGGVLADDMGLGKTLQTLAMLVDGQGKGPALVAAPTSVVGNWLDEARRFAPGLRLVVWHGPDRGPLPAPSTYDVLVTSHTLLRIEAESLLAVRWQVAVIDEAQAIKNPDSALAQVARRIDAEARFGLTGTPLENHLFELWSLFAFVVPGLLGSREVFRDRFFKPIQDGSTEAMQALRHRIRPFLLRRLKNEVATELPDRIEQVVHVDLPPDQRRFYLHLRDAYRDEVLAAVEAKGPQGATIEVFEALMRLRQACCHPQLVPLPQGQAIGDSAKLDALLEMLDEAIGGGHRSLVFSQWPSFLAYVRKALDARGIAYLYLDGQTTKRAHLQAQWNADDGPPVFLISIKAGGTGLNLTAADHVFHLDPWWNPAVEQQATDRAHRIGQKRTVFVYKLVARDTVEDKVLALQATKRALFEAAVDEGRLTSANLTAQDIRALFETGGEVVPFPTQPRLAVVPTPPRLTDLPEPEPQPTRKLKALPAPKSEPKALPAPEPQAAPESQPEASPAPAPEPKAERKRKSPPTNKSEARPEPKPTPEPAPKAEPEALPAPEPERKVVPESQPEAPPAEPTRSDEGVLSLPAAVQALIDAGTPLTNAHVRGALGIDATLCSRLLGQWVGDGLLEAHGAGRGRHYRVPG